MRGLLLGLLTLFALPSFAQAEDCKGAFSFQIKPNLSLHDVAFMLKPHSYGLGDDFMNVWEFDTDDYPVRHDKLAIALIAAGPNGNGINPVGGFVLSKFEAIFDEEESKSLNKKNGMLNAVFVMPADEQECIGLRYTISYDSKRVLYVNGQVIEKFSTD